MFNRVHMFNDWPRDTESAMRTAAAGFLRFAPARRGGHGRRRRPGDGGGSKEAV